MTTYFTTSYRIGDPGDQIPAVCTALYTGANPPAQTGGQPIAYDPPKPGQALGVATLPCADWASGGLGNAGNASNGTYKVPLSPNEMQGIGNVLWTAHLQQSKTILHFCTGGVLATCYGTNWAGLTVMQARAPTSENFAKQFVTMANWSLANPLPAPGAPDDIDDLLIIELLGGGFAIAGPVGLVWVAGVIGLAWIISPSPAYGSAMSVLVTQANQQPSTPVAASINPDGKWGSNCNFTSLFTRPHIIPGFFGAGGW